MAAQSLPRIETGTVTVSQANPEQWHAVTFEIPFGQVPVVLMGPASANDPDGVLPLVRAVTPGGFEYQLGEWDSLDGTHPEETLSYLAIEPGTHDLGGLVCRAGHTTLPASTVAQSHAVTFASAFPESPVILTQAVFASGGAPASVPEPVTLRLTARDPAGFSVRPQKEEAHGASAPGMEVHWVAVQPGWGHDLDSGASFLSALSSHPVDSAFSRVDFTRGTVAPSFLAGIQSFAEADPAVVRHRALENRSVELAVEEESSFDAETDHLGETIGTVLIWTVPEPKIEVGELQLATLTPGAWFAVDVAAEFENPVVILGVPTSNDPEPVTVRVRNADTGGFEVALDEHPYQNGVHATETVPYLVIEEGLFEIGGRIWQSGTVRGVDESGTPQLLHPAYTDAPVVLGQVASDDDPSAAWLRLSGIDETRFDLRLESQEGAGQAHGPELAHYLALAAGASNSGAALSFEAIRTATVHDHQWHQVDFSRGYVDPAVFAALQTANSPDPAGLRVREVGEVSGELMVQEETSLDAETIVESAESLGLLVIGSGLVDADGDGMPDSWERAQGLNPAIADADGDADGDGLSNLDEFLKGGHPQRRDSDGDGLEDGFEVAAGWHPGELDGSSLSGRRSAVTRLLVFRPAPAP